MLREPAARKRIAVVGGTGVAGSSHGRRRAPSGESIRLIPSWRSDVFDVEAAGEQLLPGPGARLAPMTFDAWLTGLRKPGV